MDFVHKHNTNKPHQKMLFNNRKKIRFKPLIKNGKNNIMNNWMISSCPVLFIIESLIHRRIKKKDLKRTNVRI